jgi:hypothetical protein
LANDGSLIGIVQHVTLNIAAKFRLKTAFMSGVRKPCGGGAGRVGAAMFRVAKAPDPAACKTPEAKDRRGNTRREFGRYMIALMQFLLDAQKGELGTPDRNLCFVADVRLGERIVAADDHTARMNDVSAACEQIASLWGGIEPRPSLFKKP